MLNHTSCTNFLFSNNSYKFEESCEELRRDTVSSVVVSSGSEVVSSEMGAKFVFMCKFEENVLKII